MAFARLYAGTNKTFWVDTQEQKTLILDGGNIVATTVGATGLQVFVERIIDGITQNFYFLNTSDYDILDENKCLADATGTPYADVDAVFAVVDALENSK